MDESTDIDDGRKTPHFRSFLLTLFATSLVIYLQGGSLAAALFLGPLFTVAVFAIKGITIKGIN